jgi:uncharacterized iron-regulated membrane protein
MKWKKWFGVIHLWLGLTTGTVVLILGLTGAIYCFAPEWQQLQAYRHVPAEEKPFLPPSKIRAIAESALPGRTLQRIYYDAPDKSVMVLFGKKESYSYSVFINPYSGAVLKVRDNHRDFLSVVLQLHRTLLIPFGHEIIRWSTVIFLLMLISGIVLWWPKNRRATKQGFRIMWRAHPKRLNYDLHKVLGFYVTWIVLFTALTGLMFAFEGFAGTVYRTTGEARSVIRKKPPVSDSTLSKPGTDAIDLVWTQVAPALQEQYASIMFVLPPAPNGAILVRANPDKATLYRSDFRYFDRYSGREFPGSYVWGRYADAHTGADYIRRMNYDIHTGAIFFGLPGRVGLFFVALVVASLPVTGFFFWWGRRKKKRSSFPRKADQAGR